MYIEEQIHHSILVSNHQITQFPVNDKIFLKRINDNR